MKPKPLRSDRDADDCPERPPTAIPFEVGLGVRICLPPAEDRGEPLLDARRRKLARPGLDPGGHVHRLRGPRWHREMHPYPDCGGPTLQSRSFKEGPLPDLVNNVLGNDS
jgi:hypothetical protein